MKKNDFILILILLVIILILILFINLNQQPADIAYVYYESTLIKEIDLKINNTYEVEGFNGKVVLEVLNNQIRVTEETSNYNICSNQGFISKSNQQIVCLPNKILIEIGGNEIDTEVH